MKATVYADRSSREELLFFMMSSPMGVLYLADPWPGQYVRGLAYIAYFWNGKLPTITMPMPTNTIWLTGYVFLCYLAAVVLTVGAVLSLRRHYVEYTCATVLSLTLVLVRIAQMRGEWGGVEQWNALTIYWYLGFDLVILYSAIKMVLSWKNWK